MKEFDLDSLKNSWQKQSRERLYTATDIELMLKKKSANYVKYIFYISLAEMLVLLGFSLYYYWGNDGGVQDFMRLMQRLGLKVHPNLWIDFKVLYQFIKILAVILTGYFLHRFYTSYRRISSGINLKELILSIIKLRKSVQWFIWLNLIILVLFGFVLMFMVGYRLENPTELTQQGSMKVFYISLFAGILITILIAWIYYRILYGIINKRLKKTLRQLEEISTETE